MTNSTDQTGSTQIKQIYPEIRCTHMYRQAHVHLKTKKNAGSPYLQLNTQAWSAQSTVMRNALLFFLTYSFKNEHRVEQRGKPSVFLDCKSLSRVSFGCLMPAKGHYLQTLDAGKSLKKKNKRTTVENSQEVSGKESCWTLLPLQELLCASPWSIVLPPLQVDFLQIVIAVHSHIFQRIKLRNVRVRFRTGLQFSLCHGVI